MPKVQMAPAIARASMKPIAYVALPDAGTLEFKLVGVAVVVVRPLVIKDSKLERNFGSVILGLVIVGSVVVGLVVVGVVVESPLMMAGRGGVLVPVSSPPVVVEPESAKGSWDMRNPSLWIEKKEEKLRPIVSEIPIQ